MGLFSGSQEVHEATTAAQLAEIFREQGFSADVDKLPSGKPMVRFLVEGMKCGVYFYGEVDGKPGHFNSLQFAAGFRDKISIDKANQWNKERRFVKIYADGDGDLSLDMDVDLEGGVTRKFIADKIRLWRSTFLTCIRFV